MAQIRIHEVNTRIENEVEVCKFLQGPNPASLSKSGILQ